MSGTVVEMTDVAAANSDFKKGDKVMALVGGGGYAGMSILMHMNSVMCLT